MGSSPGDDIASKLKRVHSPRIEPEPFSPPQKRYKISSPLPLANITTETQRILHISYVIWHFVVPREFTKHSIVLDAHIRDLLILGEAFFPLTTLVCSTLSWAGCVTENILTVCLELGAVSMAERLAKVVDVIQAESTIDLLHDTVTSMRYQLLYYINSAAHVQELPAVCETANWKQFTQQIEDAKLSITVVDAVNQDVEMTQRGAEEEDVSTEEDTEKYW